MPIMFNPFTSEFDFVGDNSSSGSGNVTGIPPTTPTAIARWVDTGGTVIQNSKATVQDGGGIEAQAFITRRSVTDLLVIPSGESCIAPSLELELTGSIELEPDGELIIV